MKRRSLMVALGALSALPGARAAEDAWPSRLLRIVTPLPSGGTGDVLVRDIGQRLAERLKQPVIVDNRPGGNGEIATVAAAHAAPDGYTLLFTLTQHIQVPLQFKDVKYDPIKDFTPLARIGAAATVLVCRASLPATLATDLARVPRAKPLTFGTTAFGPQIVMEVFNKSARLGMTNVPYKGEGPALIDLLSGQIDMALLTVATARPYIANGQLKPLAVIAPARAPSLPEVPTFLELGFKDVNWTGGWYAFLAPARLPGPIASRLSDEFKAIVEDAGMRAKFDRLDINVNWMDGLAFGPQMARDMATWSSLVQRSGVVVER